MLGAFNHLKDQTLGTVTKHFTQLAHSYLISLHSIKICFYCILVFGLSDVNGK